MRPVPPFISLLCSLLICAASSIAQSPSVPSGAAAAPAFATELLSQQVHHDVDAQGALWSLGRTWKARAGDDFAFIPCFGPAADRNYPIAFRLDEVRDGGRPLRLSPARAARSGDTLSFDRGAVVERYVLGADAVEQLFVVRERPDGPLALRIRAETALHAEDGPDGIRFRNAFGQVRYSPAFAIDAAGGRVPLETRLAGGAIEIVASAEQLRDLPFPLTIDPVISTMNVFTDARDSLHADTAHVAGADRYAVIWDRAFSALDHDVGITMFDADGTYVSGSQAWIDITGANWQDAKVASNRGALQFMVVAAVGDPAGGSRSIWVRTKLAHGAFTMSAPKELEPGVAGDRHHPDVGGDPLDAAFTNYLVVWESTVSAANHDIRACRLSTSAAYVGSILTVNGNAADDRNPAVSASNGNGVMPVPSWTVVWERNNPGNRDILGRRIGSDTGFGTIAAIDASALDTYAPAVSSDFLSGGVQTHGVAFVRSGAPDDIGVAAMQGITRVAETTSLAALQGVALAAREAPAIETDGCRLTVVYAASPSPGAFGKDIQAQVLHLAGGSTLGISGGPQDIDTGGNAREPAIAMPGSGGAASVESLVAWHERPIFATPATWFAAKAARFDAHSSLGGITVVPTACQGLQLGFSGIPALGLSPAYSLLNASGLSIFAIGIPTTPFYACPGCQVGVDLSLPYLLFAGPTLSIPIPCDGALVGLTVALQGADSGGDPACSQIRVSDTLLVQVQ